MEPKSQDTATPISEQSQIELDVMTMLDSISKEVEIEEKERREKRQKIRQGKNRKWQTKVLVTKDMLRIEVEMRGIIAETHGGGVEVWRIRC